MGPGGEAAAWRLLQAGKRVAVVERELIGGECAYWACIPSKTLLRAPEAKAEAARAAGVATPGLDWPELRDYRDYMVRHLVAEVRNESGDVYGPFLRPDRRKALETISAAVKSRSSPICPNTVWRSRLVRARSRTTCLTRS